MRPLRGIRSAVLDNEATALLRRHLRGRSAPDHLLIDRPEIEREIGAVRARDLDTWVNVNGGWLVPAPGVAESDSQYAVPRSLFDGEDGPPGEQPINSA